MYERFGKRLLDLSLSIFACIVLIPILVLVAVLIKVFDPGPVLFSQTRVGKDGREFRFYKFRSMPVDTGDISSDEVGELKLTWIGKLVRRTNVDELPQLFNILIGEMSVVGPRPPIPTQRELIELRRTSKVIEHKPGLTGLAQIGAFDGMQPEQKADLDCQYVKRITFREDLRIILMTFLYLFKPPPVY